MLLLADEIDVSRGDVLTSGAAPLVSSDQFAAHLVWFDDDAMLPGRRYVLKCGGSAAAAVISELKHRVSIDTMEHQAATTLGANEIGYVNMSLPGISLPSRHGLKNPRRFPCVPSRHNGSAPALGAR
jgi:bifunctional enzyme CysN/CysC